jgi:hypothetical protein
MGPATPAGQVTRDSSIIIHSCSDDTGKTNSVITNIDRVPFPHIFSICINVTIAPETFRGGTTGRNPDPESSREGIYPPIKELSPGMLYRHLTFNPARVINRPTHPLTRLRSHPHLLSPQTKQPRPPPRSISRTPPRTEAPLNKYLRSP